MSQKKKQYDRAYFDRWYRDAKQAVVSRALRENRVHLAMAAAEYVLERPVRTVLDIGCGEGSWRATLRHLRPGVNYTGVDSSEYVVKRFGSKRNIRLGTVGDLAKLELAGPFDLIVCCDVLHYVSTEEMTRGLATMVRLLGGVAFLETFVRRDDFEGDFEDFQSRSEKTYRRLFREAGLFAFGLHCYVTRAIAGKLMALESAEVTTSGGKYWGAGK